MTFLRALLARRIPGARLPPADPAGLSAEDWRRLPALAEHHQLAPLVHIVLREDPDLPVPAPVRGAFAVLHRTAVLNALALESELERLARAFKEEALPWLSWKGPALARRLWGDPALRPSGDLDLVVGRLDWVRAVALLRGLDYQPVYPLPVHAPAVLFRSGQHCWYFQHATRGIELELHWTFSPPSFPSPCTAEAAIARAWMLPASGSGLPVPDPADDLLLLCCHAAKHCWESLLGLADIAAALGSPATPPVAALLERAGAAGCGTLTAVALRLAASFTGLPAPPGTDTPRVRALADQAWESWAAAGWQPRHGNSVRYVLSLVRRQAALQDDVGGRIRCLGLVFTPKKHEIAGSALVPALSPLLYLKRPVGYLRRAGGAIR